MFSNAIKSVLPPGHYYNTAVPESCESRDKDLRRSITGMWETGWICFSCYHHLIKMMGILDHSLSCLMLGFPPPALPHADV